MSDYPEHDKLTLVHEKSQAIGEFIDWLGSEKFIHLLTYVDDSVGYVPAGNIQDLLAEFFDIDLKVIDQEKRAMIEQLRTAHP